MTRLLKLLAIAVLAMLVMAPAASAQRRGFAYRGGIGFYGPGWGYYPPYGGWGWGWGWPYGYYPAPSAGEVKIVTRLKDASVYVDGGYAGVAGKLKKFPLDPGNHDIQLRNNDGHAFHEERVHIIPGKTVTVEGDLPAPR